MSSRIYIDTKIIIVNICLNVASKPLIPKWMDRILRVTPYIYLWLFPLFAWRWIRIFSLTTWKHLNGFKQMTFLPIVREREREREREIESKTNPSGWGTVWVLKWSSIPLPPLWSSSCLFSLYTTLLKLNQSLQRNM